jgi:hypothetical protein
MVAYKSSGGINNGLERHFMVMIVRLDECKGFGYLMLGHGRGMDHGMVLRAFLWLLYDRPRSAA